jgi:Integrase zinc binding domain
VPKHPNTEPPTSGLYAPQGVTVTELADFNIQLVYKPGATNCTDALSRRPDLAPDTDDYPLLIALPNHLFVPPDTPTRSYATTRQKDTAKDSDPGYESNEMELVDHSIPILKARAATLLNGSELSAKYLDDKIMHDQETQRATIQRWRLSHSLTKNGRLWTKDGALVVVGNNDVKRGVISLFHDTSTVGHPRITKTLLMTAKYYWWLGMKEFTTNYVKGCATCQMTKVNTHPTKPALFPITAEPNALPFQTIAVDFIIKLPTLDGYDSILTITDHDCSKAAIFLPCNESIDAPRVAELYTKQVFPHYSIPCKIISDRDPRFTANLTTELCKTLGIKQNISSAYHPQTDRQSERTNQSLEQYL